MGEKEEGKANANVVLKLKKKNEGISRKREKVDIFAPNEMGNAYNPRKHDRLTLVWE